MLTARLQDHSRLLPVVHPSAFAPLVSGPERLLCDFVFWERSDQKSPGQLVAGSIATKGSLVAEMTESVVMDLRFEVAVE